MLSLWLDATAPATMPVVAAAASRIMGRENTNLDDRLVRAPARTSVLGPAVATAPELALVSESLAAGLAESARAGAAIIDRTAAVANKRPVKRMADLFRGCGTSMPRRQSVGRFMPGSDFSLQWRRFPQMIARFTGIGRRSRLFALLFAMFVSSGTAASASSDPAEILARLHLQDRAVERVGFRLAAANADLCPGGADAGFSVHTLEQYGPAYRAAAARLFGLDDHPGAMASTPG